MSLGGWGYGDVGWGVTEDSGAGLSRDIVWDMTATDRPKRQ